jgi:hypothetical protein
MAETSIQHEDAHEQRDISRWRLLLFLALFAALLIIVSAVLWLFYGLHDTEFSAANRADRLPDDLELEQRDQLAQYMASQKAELERLAWTDNSKQFAKVPIEDAMRLLATKGAAR